MRRLLLAVTTWEWLLLLLLLPLLFYPSPIGALSLLALPAFWSVRKVSTGHFFPETAYNTAIWVLGVTVLISFVAVFDIELSFPKISGLVMGIALYFAAVEHCHQRESGVWNITAIVILAGTAMSLFAIPFARWPAPLQFLNEAKTLLPPQISTLPGTVNGFVNPNELAGVMAWIVPLLVAVTFGYGSRLWRGKRWYSRVVLFILTLCLTINLLALLASGSRGGMVSVAIAILVMLAIESPWGRWLLLVGMIAGVIAIISFGPEKLLTVPSGTVESLGLQARLEIWSRGIYGLKDFPLTGMSMNGFRRLVHIFYPLTVVSVDKDIGHAHNQLLQAGLDLGLLGLIAYLSTWFLSAGLLWDRLHIKEANARLLRPLLIGLAGSLTAGWFFGILDAIALGAKPGFIWWLLLALVAVSSTTLYQLQPVKVGTNTAV